MTLTIILAKTRKSRVTVNLQRPCALLKKSSKNKAQRALKRSNIQALKKRNNRHAFKEDSAWDPRLRPLRTL